MCAVCSSWMCGFESMVAWMHAITLSYSLAKSCCCSSFLSEIIVSGYGWFMVIYIDCFLAGRFRVQGVAGRFSLVHPRPFTLLCNHAVTCFHVVYQVTKGYKLVILLDVLDNDTQLRGIVVVVPVYGG